VPVRDRHRAAGVIWWTGDQNVPSVAGGASLVAAAFGAGTRAGRRSGAPGAGSRPRGARPERDPRRIRRGARISALSSGDDDRAPPLLVHAGSLLVAPDRSGGADARRFHGGDGPA